jgi:serine phosphatase RsbU (regulator of sigma subunit)
VITATDGHAAVRMIRSVQPDLVVLDLTLPGLDGLEVCRRVRDCGLRIPIVMLSARRDEQDRVRGLDLGADDYVTKPFSLPELFARIRGILRHRESWLSETSELRRDLKSASDVQRALFPRLKPVIADVDFAGACLPARVVGGDYYDYFNLGAAGLALLVADVAGKGASAALLMANLQGCVRATVASHGDDCARLARHLNGMMYATTDASRYATLVYAVLDASSGRLTFVNAGHTAAFLIGDAGDVQTLDSTGPPIGLFDSLPFSSQHYTLRPDTWLVMISDGISEAVDHDDLEYGRERLFEVVRRHRDADAATLCDAVLHSVLAHAGATVQADDLTIVTARRRVNG